MNPNENYKNYINNSKTHEINSKLKIRIHTSLEDDYKEGKFNNFINLMTNSVKEIDRFNIEFRGNSNPVFYIYLLPLENCQAILRTPSNFDRGNGGGRPIRCLDYDGFKNALGITENLASQDKEIYESIFKRENAIHELMHLIMHHFIEEKDRYISEGFAEAAPLYGLNMIEEYQEYMDMIKNIKEEDIYTVEELIKQEKDNTYGDKLLTENDACPFRASYLSSFLVIASILEQITKKYNVSSIESINIFLHLFGNILGRGQIVIYTLADELDMNKEKLFFTKEYQLEFLNKLKRDV